MQRDANEKTSGAGRTSSGMMMQSPGMMGSLLVSGIGHNNAERMNDMESRVLMGSEEEEGRLFEPNKQDLFLETEENGQDQVDDQRAE